MSNLKYWQDKIKEKRSKTEFRDFLMEIVSWYPFAFYKRNNLITSFPNSKRINDKIVLPLNMRKKEII